MLLNTHQQGYIDIYKNNVVFHELQRMNSKKGEWREDSLSQSRGITNVPTSDNDTKI